MDAAEWETLNRLLDSALDLPPEARAGWIDRLGPEHAALRDRLRRLLSSSSADLIGTLPRLDLDTETIGDPEGPAVSPGSAVGQYRLIRQIAQGGMGSVWFAERSDGLITRPVAVKLPRGSWHRATLLDRMAREREILSRLDHPHIGRLYDTGLTDGGQPYLALEYVEGRHIDAYCADRRLTVAARLQLFLQVLDAVAHAHSRLIVHRDLKPANILVTHDGQVKLLDFGIAKLLTEGLTSRTELTEAAGRPLTPGYASPEQLAGEPLTTASDVYSLGVVLYELLTGVRPPPIGLDARDAERASVQGGPPLPSTATRDRALGSELRGDLDTIVLKALRASPGERYATVNAVADDIRRHLDGLPILARPDSAWYRARKFVRRNAVPVSAAALAVLAVLIGAGAAVWQARVAFAEQRRAEEVTEFIASIFEGASPYAAAGQTLSAVDLLEQARARIDRLDTASPELRVELLTIVGASFADLTDMATAEEILREAVEEGARTIGPDHELTLHARTALAQPQRFIGEREQARAELADLLPRLRRSPGLAEDLAEALESHATVAMSLGRWDEAEASSREMLQVARSRLGERHPLSLAARWSLVQTYQLAGKAREAAEQADLAFPMTVEAHRGAPRAPELIEARELYGRVLTNSGRLQEGIALIDTALRDAADVFGESSLHVAYYAANLAARRLELGDLDAALQSIDRGLDVSAVRPGESSGLHAFALHIRGQILLAARRGEEALSQLDLAIERLAASEERASQALPAARAERALALAYTGQVDRARAELQEAGAPVSRIRGMVERLAGDHAAALDTQRQALAAIKPDTRADRARSLVLTEMGLDLLELGRPDAAVEALNEALLLSRALERTPSPEHADALVGLGRARLAQQRAADALPLLVEADGFWRQFGPESRWAGEAALWLGLGYEALGQRAEAAPVLDRARAILARSPLPSDTALVRLAAGRR